MRNDSFKNLLLYFLNYILEESNEEIKKLLREKLVEYTNEAQNMKLFLKQMNVQELAKSNEQPSMGLVKDNSKNSKDKKNE